MEDFISCSSYGTESLRSLAIMLGSDETSAVYCAEIRNMFLDVRVDFVDLDAYVKVRMEETTPVTYHNNFYLFRLQSG
jgi:hypothetical protein